MGTNSTSCINGHASCGRAIIKDSSARLKEPLQRSSASGEAFVSQYFSVHPTHPQRRLLVQAADIVRGGGVIVYPTDSTYALGCHIGDKAALDRIREIRRLDMLHHFTLGVPRPCRSCRSMLGSTTRASGSSNISHRDLLRSCSTPRAKCRADWCTPNGAPSAFGFRITSLLTVCSKHLANR